MENVKAAVFDLDNTLADRKYAYRRHAEKCADMFLKDMTLKEKFIERLVFLDNNGYNNKKTVYNTIYEEFPLNGSPSEMSAVWNVSAAEFTVPEPYAAEALEYLSGKYTLALLSNGYTVTQNIKLDKTGLRRFFSAVLISEETGTAKPAPEIFHMICGRIALPAENCVYIGDHFEFDVKGALSAGMRAVLYDRYGTSAENYSPVIHSLEELREIL